MKIPRDEADALAQAEDCIQLWTDRDDRMREDQREWELEQKGLKKYEERVAVPDSAHQVDKFALEVSRADLQVAVAANTEADRPAAQAIEDAAYFFIDELEDRHRRRGHSGLQYEVAHTHALRGWNCAEVMLAPDRPDFPWTVRHLDPINVYPDTDDGEPGLVVHRYQTTRATLESYWGKATVDRALTTGPTLSPSLRSENVTCYGFYTDTETGVLVETGAWLKKPEEHHYGFRPLIIATGPGASYRAVDAHEQAHVKFIGTSLLRTIKDVIRDKQRVAQILRRALSLSAAPPTIGRRRDTEASVDDIPMEPGEAVMWEQGDDAQMLVPPAMALQHGTALLSMLQDSQNRGGLGQALWGEGQPGSGYDRQKMLGTSMAVIEARVQALRWFYQEILRGMLRLYALYGGPDLNYIAKDRTTGLQTAANRLSPTDVLGADVRLTVRFGRLQHVDLMQMGNLASQLTQQGLISHEYALDQLLQVDNPTAIMKQALRDQFYKDPQLLRLRVLMEKQGDPMDPMGAMLASMLFQQEFQKFTLTASGMGAPAPPGPGPNQPPLPGSGMPSAALPDELGQNAGMPPNMAALLGAPQAGAGMQPLVPPGMM